MRRLRAADIRLCELQAMSQITIIGDVHGKTSQYQKLIRQKLDGKRTLQLGDMGIGFKGVGLHEMPLNHHWFRGNHDDPAKCRLNPNYIGDFGYLENLKLYWVAGAWSIDWEWRTEGVSWWRDEELSYAELDYAIQEHMRVRPEFMVSHEAPSSAAEMMLGGLLLSIPPSSPESATSVQHDEEYGYYKAKLGCVKTRTSQALQTMLGNYAPKEWVFGHYHVAASFYLPGIRTKFTCVPELGTYELNTGGNNGITL